MTEDPRLWVGLTVVVVGAMAFFTVALLISSRGEEAGRVKRALAIIWACALGALGVAWWLRSQLGGPVVDLDLSASPNVMSRSLEDGQMPVVLAGLAILAGLCVTALITLRRLMASIPAEEIEPDVEDGS